jgi:TatD DNase family protein
MFIDTHAHVNFNAFKDDADAVLKRALQNNTWVIMPGTQFSTSERAVRIAQMHEHGVYAAIGLHPIHLAEKRRVDALELQSETPAPLETARPGRAEFLMGFETQGEEFAYEKYKQLGQSKKVVAIGECGLDYYYEPKGKEKREAQRRKQKTALALQVKLAEELNLPVIFHCRKAHDDLIEFLKDKKILGVVHCYTGNLVQAEKFYEMGLYFGFNGLIFKKVPALPDPKEVIVNIPLDRILLETDSPYLVPPEAGVERNEPLFVRYVVQEIARIKSVSLKEVASVTVKNARELFQI